MVNNNKHLIKTKEHSDSELRKMFPKDGADIGIAGGENLNENGGRVTKRSKMSHNDDW